MTAAGVWFLVIIILNTIVCVLFVIWGYFQQMYSDDSELKRTQMTMPGYYLQAFVLVLYHGAGDLCLFLPKWRGFGGRYLW